MERFKLIASIYLFLIRDGKILLMRRFRTGYEDGNYGLPAGHLEDNESATEGLLREVKEEIGIKIKASDLQLVHVMHRREKDNRLDLFYTSKSFRGKIKNTEPNKCDDVRWFELDKLPKNIIPYIKKALRCYQKGIIYSEVGW